MKILVFPSVAGALLGLALIASPAAQADYVEIKKQLQSDSGGGDHYGEIIALDGDTMVVRGNESGGPTVYVYERNADGSNAWGEARSVTLPPGMAPSDYAGRLEISGDFLAVGVGIDIGIETPWRGVVVLERDSVDLSRWEFHSLLEKPDRGTFQDFGYTGGVSISGDYLIVGGNLDEEADGLSSGAAYVYERDPEGGWVLAQKLMGSDTQVKDQFGRTVSLDGDTAVVGAWLGDVDGIRDAGAAYVFERGEDGVWTEVSKLVASIHEVGDVFGSSVALEGDLIAVGAPLSAPTGTGNSGAVFLYERDAGGADQWGEVALLIHHDEEIGDIAGSSVALDGGRVFFGAPGRDDGEIRSVGAVYVFERELDEEWQQVSELMPDLGNDIDSHGEALAVSNGTVVVSAPNDDDGGVNAGAVFVYQEVASPELAVAGECPGDLAFTLAEATPGGAMAVVYSASEGGTVVPGGTCAGVLLGLDEAELAIKFLAEPGGVKTFEKSVGANACGLFLQVVDMVTCGVGPVVQVP